MEFVTRKCHRCKTTKNLDSFYNFCKDKEGKGFECMDCCKARHKEKNKTSSNKIHRKDYMLKWYHGITLEDYNKMFEDQKGCCAICGKHQNELNKILVVDHDHVTEKIRGLLCNFCNWGLGYFKDNVNVLISAEKYLTIYN